MSDDKKIETIPNKNKLKKELEEVEEYENKVYKISRM